MDDQSDVRKNVESPVSFFVCEKCVENISNFYFHNDHW